MFLATVILLLSCIEITSSSSNLFCLQFDQTRTWWLRCANRLQTCSISTPAANMVKLYSFNPFWTMITTMFQENQTCTIFRSQQLEDFFPKLMLLCSLSRSFHWFIQLCNETLQHFARFWRLFRSVMWSILVPFEFHFSFLTFFLDFFFWNSGQVFNKTIILLELAGYQMIITNSALRASLVIYHSISSAPS